MPLINGIAVPPTIRVRCTNKTCPAPADTRVNIPTLAPGVAGLPTLLCIGCGHIPAEVTD